MKKTLTILTAILSLALIIAAFFVGNVVIESFFGLPRGNGFAIFGGVIASAITVFTIALIGSTLTQKGK